MDARVTPVEDCAWPRPRGHGYWGGCAAGRRGRERAGGLRRHSQSSRCATSDVAGRTAAEIRASLNRNNASDPATGARFDAYTQWDMDWQIPGEREGPCRLNQAEVPLAITVGLPRLVDTEGGAARAAAAMEAVPGGARGA